MLRFDSAEVSLETVLKQVDSTSADFWIITAEASVTDAVTQTLTFKLEKRPTVPKSVAAPQISEALRRAIEDAQEDLSKALKGRDLQLAQLSAAIKFAVEVTKSGSVGTEIKIVPITIGSKKTFANSAAHTIKLNFAKPEPNPKTS